MKEKNLLVITSIYPFKSDHRGIFIKNQIEILREDFETVFVISPLAYFPKFLLKFKLFQSISGYTQYPNDYSYENIYVFFPRYIPVLFFGSGLLRLKSYLITKAVFTILKDKKIKFDIIHAHFTWPSGNIGVKLKKKYQKPVVTTIHENGEWFDAEVGMNHPLINAAWSEADALIRVNMKDVPVLKHYNDHVYAIPNGYSPAFHPIDTIVVREKLGLSANQKIIFSVGALIKRKGFEYLIEAMEKICSQRKDIICYIGGVGPERERLLGQINRLHLKEKVTLLGSVPGDQLTLWMNSCDFFVLPSLNEGNPTVMFETLGCGKPFVGTKVGGVPEIITSDEYGLLVKPADSEDLERKILQALDREWNREAILRYSEQFTWENISKKISAIYQEIGVHSEWY
jgi:glycosyltransferase involved in cell wall biosynthesis